MITRRQIRFLTNFGILFFIFAILYAALNSSWAHRYYSTLLQNKTDWIIRTDKLHINPFIGTVRIRKAEIRSPDQRSLMAAGNIYVRVNPLSLLRGKIIVSRLELKNVYLSFTKDPHKKDDGPPKFTHEYITQLAKKIANNFALQNITVLDGQITPITIMLGKKAGGYVQFDFDNFEFEVSQNILRKNDFVFSADNFFVNHKNMATHLAVDSVLSGERVIIDNLRWTRPEGYYEAELDVSTESDLIAGEIRITADIPNIFDKKLIGEGRVKLTPPNLYLEPFKIDAGDMVVQAPGKMFVPKGDYEVDVKLGNTDLEAVGEVFDLSILKQLQGLARLQGKLKGRLPELKAEAEVDGENVIYGALNFSQLNAGIQLQGRRFKWQAKVPQAGRTVVDANGQVEMRGSPMRPFLEKLEVQIDGASLKPIFVAGQLEGALSGKGTLLQKEKGFGGGGALTLSDGRVAILPVEKAQTSFDVRGDRLHVTQFSTQVTDRNLIVARQPFDIIFSREKVSLQGKPLPGLLIDGFYHIQDKAWRVTKLSYNEGINNFTASGAYLNNANFELNLNGLLDASLLEFYREVFIGANGPIESHLSARGNFERPVLNGSLDFNRVTLDLRGFGDPIRHLVGKVLLRPNQLVFQKMLGSHGDGDFGLDGSMGLSGWKPSSFNLKLFGNGLTFRVRGAMQADFDTNLTVTGSMPSPLVAGRVELQAGRYYKRFILTKAFFDDQGVQDGDSAISELFDEWRWDVQVRNSGDLRIENNIADVFLSGDLRLKGTTRKPVIDGVVTTTGGELHYLGHDLQITEGALEFSDPTRINPQLRLEAQEEVVGAEDRGIQTFYTVFVKLEGPLDNLQTTLWSSPPVDQADVVSLLAFGMTQSELRARGSARRSFATNLIANSLTSGFGEGLGDVVGLDILRFESAAGSTEAISGVAVGKNLSDRLSVEFYTDITPDSAQRRVRSKYYLTDLIFLEGINTVDDGQNEFELNVSLQFKIR